MNAIARGRIAALRRALANRVPRPMLAAWRRARLLYTRWRNRRRSTAQVFSLVYARNVWGGAPGEFYSGSGSDPDMAGPYSAMIREFLRSLPGTVRVVDLGCGDFRVGRTLLADRVHYVGVDVVPELVAQNVRRFGAQGVEFHCRDVIVDPLPDGDVCLVRQVLQHLSNAQILDVLVKLKKYPHVFVTEHYPDDESRCVPNKDKPHGGDVRLYDNSAVYLDRPPFSLEGVQLVLSVPHRNGGVIRTFRWSPLRGGQDRREPHA